MPVIYIDVLFFTNFITDLLLIYCTGKLSGERISRFRITLGAMFGGIYASAVFFPHFKPIYLALCKVAASVLLLAISFSIKSPKHLLRLMVCFYITNFIFGGAVMFIMYFTNFAADAMLSNGSLYFNLSFGKLMITALSSTVLISVSVKMIKAHLYRRGVICRVTVTYESRTITADGFFDTGNTLCDPVCGLPVTVTDADTVAALFDADIADFIKAGDIESIYEKDGYTACAWRFVPYSSLGNPHGIIPAFKPTRFSVKSEGLPEFDADCLIAVAPHKIGKSGYKMIVNPLISGKVE